MRAFTWYRGGLEFGLTAYEASCWWAVRLGSGKGSMHRPLVIRFDPVSPPELVSIVVSDRLGAPTRGLVHDVGIKRVSYGGKDHLLLTSPGGGPKARESEMALVRVRSRWACTGGDAAGTSQELDGSPRRLASAFEGSGPCAGEDTLWIMSDGDAVLVRPSGASKVKHWVVAFDEGKLITMELGEWERCCAIEDDSVEEVIG